MGKKPRDLAADKERGKFSDPVIGLIAVNNAVDKPKPYHQMRDASPNKKLANHRKHCCKTAEQLQMILQERQLP